MINILSHIDIKCKFSRRQHNIRLGDKKGVVLAETILIIAISLVLVITIFYPTFRNIISNTLVSITNWYTSALANLGL